MRRLILIALGSALLTLPLAQAYVEAPHSLGRVVQESSHIIVLEVVKVNAEKGLIYYKKVGDLKNKDANTEFKHNIGKRGFHPRESQNIMAWAEPGKKAVFFHNGGASETCIGTYWYQCYKEGEWWGMTHAEPFLLRTYCGEADKLVEAVTAIAAGREVVVPCMADANKVQLHERKGKLQLLKASLKLLDYNARRDFAGFADGGDFVEYKTIVLLAESSAGWKYLPTALATAAGNRWQRPDFDSVSWRDGRAPVGYGEPELDKRKGTTVPEKGQDFLFRREVLVPPEVLNQKGVIFRLCVASDNSAEVYLNGKAADVDPEADHEFTYWNREIELPPGLVQPGKNLIAARVKNTSGSSDLYFDMELSAQIPLPKKAKKK